MKDLEEAQQPNNGESKIDKAVVDAAANELVQLLVNETRGVSDGDAMSTLEISESLGISVKVIRRMLRKEVDNGTIEPVLIIRKNIAGILQRIAGYRIIEKEESDNVEHT